MILVTGGTGFVGTQLVKDLVESGHSVRVLSREDVYNPRVNIVKGDLLDKESLKKALKDVETVIHLAGKISYNASKEEIFKVNYEGTKNLLEACKNVKKLLFSSSVAVYGEIKEPAIETQPPTPKTIYGESKVAGEKAIQESGIPNICFRLSVIYGTNNPIWNDVFKMFSKGFPIPKTNNETNLLHVSDASKAFQIGLKKGSGIYNIPGNQLPFMDLARILAAHLGIEPRFWPPSVVKFFAGFKGKRKDVDAFIQNRLYDGTKAREELGFEPKADLYKCLKEMVETYKNK